MGTITLWMQVSLDGYAEGPDGAFDWPIIDDELHQYFNEHSTGRAVRRSRMARRGFARQTQPSSAGPRSAATTSRSPDTAPDDVPSTSRPLAPGQTSRCLLLVDGSA